MHRFRTLIQLGRFVLRERNFALIPILVVLLLLAGFIIVAEVPVLTPFIYALF